jgi:hypothetical protein
VVCAPRQAESLCLAARVPCHARVCGGAHATAVTAVPQPISCFAFRLLNSIAQLVQFQHVCSWLRLGLLRRRRVLWWALQWV